MQETPETNPAPSPLARVRRVLDAVVRSPKGSIGSIDTHCIAQVRVVDAHDAVSALAALEAREDAVRSLIERAERLCRMASLERDPQHSAGRYWLPRNPIIYLRDSLSRLAALEAE